MASAEVVAVVRHRIDELQQGMVLRQLEGSSHDFLWGWSPDKVPNEAWEAKAARKEVYVDRIEWLFKNNHQGVGCTCNTYLHEKFNCSCGRLSLSPTPTC